MIDDEERGYPEYLQDQEDEDVGPDREGRRALIIAVVAVVGLIACCALSVPFRQTVLGLVRREATPSATAVDVPATVRATSITKVTVTLTATLEPTVTPTASPTTEPTPSATPTLPTDEEEYNLYYERAQEEGRATACNKEGDTNCRDEVLSYPDALLSLLRLPEYTDKEPLARSLNTIVDVTDSELERWLELAISEGLYPSEVWCGSSDRYLCPPNPVIGITRPVNREAGPKWLQMVIFGSDVPVPCKDSFTDTRSPWVEALACPLEVYQFRMNPYGMWRPGDPISKGDWDVLKEQLLEIREGGEK